MKLKDIIKQLDKDFPFSWAMEWDNVGLLIGDMEAEIHKVFLNLDVTDEAVAEASLWGADLILTHHPLLFSPARTVTEQNFIGRRIRRLIKEDINYVAMHTNFDIAKMADSAMSLQAVRVYGDPDRMVRTCAVSSGSGRSEIRAALYAGADVLVTGDLDYHTSIDANAQGLALIDAGHYGTEFVYITYMEDYLKKTFPELSVRSMKIKQPYSIL